MAKKTKSAAQASRNTTALAAWSATGSGKHDSRPRRQRTRSAARRAAIAVSW
jgi:hypothetical protein